MAKIEIPTFNQLFQTVLDSLRNLGGSATNEEILAEVSKIEEFSDDQLESLHLEGPRSEIEYRVAWSKTYLKRNGYLENSKRSVWSLTKKGWDERNVNKDEVVKNYRAMQKKLKTEKKNNDLTDIDSDLPDTELWLQDLIQEVRNVSPRGFEYLCSTVLRENGFSEVKVTGKSGDEGIDGEGILKIALLSFKVAFQCKRYNKPVSSSHIRNFRGSLPASVDKGIFVTTSTFTKSAIDEANTDAKVQIDLIDGVEFCNLLKKSNLGVKSEQIEKVTIDSNFFIEFKD